MNLKMGTLMGFFCPKLKIFELKIYRGVMCHENEEPCKNWRGIDFSVQNWHEQLDEFWFKHSKISKICTFKGVPLTKVYYVWPKKITMELCLIALNIDPKFEGKLTFAFKNDMRNLGNFHQRLESLKIWTLMGFF